MAYAVIMAGGSGTRFWPRSRRARPKQLIRVVGELTLLQQTVRRLRPAIPAERTMVVTREDHVEESLRQLADYPGIKVVAEPEPRDTAACIGLAATIIEKADPGAVMVAAPADHVISQEEKFRAALAQAEQMARDRGVFVTLGIVPRAPSTQFGYIERGELLGDGAQGGFRAYDVVAFREKPDQVRAGEFVESGRFYWNSGTFVWRVTDILDAIGQHMPKLRAGLARISEALGTERQGEVIAEEYGSLEKMSVDYGIMEKVGNTAVLEVDYDWDDVGSWEALPRLHGTDEKGNTVQGRAYLLDTRDCVVVSEGDHLVGTVGVKDLVIVHSNDATLVCRKDRAADVKTFVSTLEEHGFSEYL